MNSRQSFRELTPLIRAVHVFLLLGWLLSSHGIAPAICMMAASLDGDHDVTVGAAADGGIRVVLSHQKPGSDAGLVPHQHDALCQLLMVFALSPRLGEIDHVLAFQSVNDASRAARRQVLHEQAVPIVAAPVFVVLHQIPFSKGVCVKTQTRPHAWFPGLAMKTGRTIMLC